MSDTNEPWNNPEHTAVPAYKPQGGVTASAGEAAQGSTLRRYLYKKTLFNALRKNSVRVSSFPARIQFDESADVTEPSDTPAVPEPEPSEDAATQPQAPEAQQASAPEQAQAGGVSPPMYVTSRETPLEELPVAEPAFDRDEGVSASIVTNPDDLTDADEPAEKSTEQDTLSVSGMEDGEEEEPAKEEDVDLGELRKTLMALQQQVRAAKIPVVIVFEGWDAGGKGTMVSRLIEGLDPRGYQVYPIRKPTEEERKYPAMRRYWVKMPAQGNISIFCSSWYREVSNACFESKAARKSLRRRYDEIVNMESELACDGVVLIKFFLHISRKEQKQRLKKLESKKNTRWRVDKEDWEQNQRYEEYLRLYDAMIARTHYDGMLWHVLRGENKRACTQQVFEAVIDELRTALDDRAQGKRTWDTPFLPHLENITTQTFPDLDTFDSDQALTDPYKPAMDKVQKRLSKLQNELYRRGIPMAVCFEGWDAAGKGGAIRRLTAALDARAFDVVPIASPTPLEKSHHHLWRFWNTVPEKGHIAIFDRTWYGRVMVERIEGYCTQPQWKRAYDEINRFEAELTANGTILCKFWLQIDSDTQLTRFRDRENTPDKQWKITDEDWRNRDKWPEYEVAVNEMLQKTNTSAAPWTVVEANNKQYARLKVLQTVIHAIESRLEAEKH